jgi:transcriptional regulator with XRE-family HTH domain
LAKLTQANLVHRAGLHRNVVGLLERGEMSPALRTVDRLAEALDIPLHDLLREIADQPGNGAVRPLAASR